MIAFVKSLLPYVRPYWKMGVGSIALSFVLAGIKGLQAFLVKPIFDDGLSRSSSLDEALFYAMVLFISVMVNFPARFFHFYWIRYVVDRATCVMRLEMFSKLQKLPMKFYSKSKQGTLVSNLLNDTMVFSQGFRSSVDLIREPVTAVVMLGIALYHDWQLSLVVFVVTPLFAFIFIVSGRKVRYNQSDVQEEISSLTHNISEGISAQKITKAFNLQNYVISRFEKAQDMFFKAQMRTTFVEEMAHPFVELVGGAAFAGVVVFAWYRITSGELTTGGFISFMVALALLMDPIRKFSQANVKFNQARAAGYRLFHILSLEEEVDDGDFEIEKFNDKVELKNIGFSYGDGKVIENLSITIKKGQKIALVGLSGSGKSTLINLLLGLYKVSSGDILIDGVSINSIPLKNLRALFGLVSQDIFLFHDTVLENLKVGRDYTGDKIDEALNVAYASGYIKKLSDGISTVVGDRGTILSGGQQQRLTIARAFLRDTDVLLFDEATSALDNESEKVVQKALDQLGSDKTVIAVAHRLSTIQEFDRIFVLNDGKLVEQGTHDQLMSLSGEYAKLYELSRKS